VNTDTPHPERPGTINGIWMIAAVLSLFAIVPAVVFTIWTLVGETKALPPLDYTQRHHWQTMELRSREIEYNKFVQGETGKQYKKVDFPITPEEEAMLHRCVAMVQREGFFEDADRLGSLKALADEYPDQFYPPYLVARWLEHDGQITQAEAWYTIAFERATGAIIQRLVNDDGNALPNYVLPTVAIAYDRVFDGELDTTLMLVYPEPTSDAAGLVTLPTFESVYRLTDPALPPGVFPPLHPERLTLLPQTPTRQYPPNWFSSPYRVGRLDDAVIESGQ